METNTAAMQNKTQVNPVITIIKNNIKTLRAGDLTSDANFQRGISKNQVQFIVDNFDITYWDYPKVAEVDGRYIVWDGQHRVAAVRKKFGDDQMIDCFVDVCTYEEAAKRFAHQNDGKNSITTVDQFKALVESNDPRTVVVNTALEAHGLRIGGTQISNGISAVKDTMKAFEILGDERFDIMLRIISESFDKVKEARSSKTIRGLTYFLKQYTNLEVDEEYLIETMKRQPKGYNTMIEMLIDRGVKQIRRDKFEAAFAFAMGEQYNYNKRARRIDLGKL